MDDVQLSVETISVMIGAAGLFFAIISGWIVRDRQISRNIEKIRLQIKDQEILSAKTYANKQDTLTLTADLMTHIKLLREEHAEICRRIDSHGRK